MKRFLVFLVTMILVLAMAGEVFATDAIDPVEMARAEAFLEVLPDPATFRYVNQKGQVFESVPSDEPGYYYLRSTNENGVENTFSELGAGFFAHLDYVYMTKSVIISEMVVDWDQHNWNIPRVYITFWDGDKPKIQSLACFSTDIIPGDKLVEFYEGKLCITQWEDSGYYEGIDGDRYNIDYDNFYLKDSTGGKMGYPYFHSHFDTFEIHETGGVYATNTKGLSTFAPYQGKRKKEAKMGALLEGTAVWDFGKGIAWISPKGKLSYTTGFDKAVALNPKKGTKVELYADGEEALVVYKLPPDKNGDIKLQKIVPGENKDKPVDIEQSEYAEIQGEKSLVKNGVFLEGSAVMDIGQGIAWVDAKGKLCYTAGFGPAATLNPKKGTEVELYVGGEDSLVIYKLPPDKNGDIKLQKIVPGENNDKPVDIEQSEYEEIERTYTLRDFPEK